MLSCDSVNIIHLSSRWTGTGIFHANPRFHLYASRVQYMINMENSNTYVTYTLTWHTCPHLHLPVQGVLCGTLLLLVNDSPSVVVHGHRMLQRNSTIFSQSCDETLRWNLHLSPWSSCSIFDDHLLKDQSDSLHFRFHCIIVDWVKFIITPAQYPL